MSLQWKTTLFLILLLMGVGTGFIIHEQRVLENQYRILRFNEMSRQVSLSEEAVRQIFLQLQMVSGTLATREDIRMALSRNDPAGLGKKFDNDWSILQINSGLSMARLLNKQGRLVKEESDFSTAQVPAPDDPEMLQRHLATVNAETPQTFASCSNVCRLYAWAPVQYRGAPAGTIMVAAPITEAILLFNRGTQLDIGIVRQRDPAGSAPAAVRDDDVVGMTGGELARRTIKNLSPVWRRSGTSAATQWQETLVGDTHYEVARWPISVGTRQLPADFLLITNVEQVYADMRNVLQKSILTTIGGMLLAALAAVFLSRILIQRLKLVTAAIVLLGRKQHAAARDKLGQAGSRLHLGDELDDVTQTTLCVANNLEEMEIEARNYQNRLSHMLAELEQERSFIANLLDTAPVLVVVHNARGEVTLCNQFASTLMGAPRSEGGIPASLFFPTEVEMAACRSLPADGVARHESILQDAAGESHHIAWLHCRLTRNATHPLVLSVGQDITPLQQAQAERERLQGHLLQAQKMEAIGQLTGGIAHDFNNLLGGIMGYTALALDRCVPDKESKLAGYLAEVIRSGERARDIIAQMLTFSRPGGDNVHPMQLGSLVKEVVKFLRPMLPEGMNIAVDIGDTPLVRANPVQIQQMLMNLMINARDAMPPDGDMAVRLRYARIEEEVCASCRLPISGSFVELSVGDNGSGIVPEDVNRIFDPFYTTKEVGKGSGMGLSVVHGLAHKFRGHILLATTPGAGSRFGLLFPTSVND